MLMYINVNFREGETCSWIYPFIPAAGVCTAGRGMAKAWFLLLPPQMGFEHLPCSCPEPGWTRLPLAHKWLCQKVRKDDFYGDTCPTTTPALNLHTSIPKVQHRRWWSCWEGAHYSAQGWLLFGSFMSGTVEHFTKHRQNCSHLDLKHRHSTKAYMTTSLRCFLRYFLVCSVRGC